MGRFLPQACSGGQGRACRQTHLEFAFVVDEHGMFELSDDGEEILDEAMFRGLPGFRGPTA
jgi:hypothetical protein